MEYNFESSFQCVFASLFVNSVAFFSLSADWHEGAASVELGSTSLVIWNMSWMHYLRKFFSFDAFTVLVLVLIVCMWWNLDLLWSQYKPGSTMHGIVVLVSLRLVSSCGTNCGYNMLRMWYTMSREADFLLLQDRQSKQISIPKRWQVHDCRSQPLCRWLQLSCCWSHYPWAPWLNLT